MQPASGLRGAREAHGPSGVPSRGYYGNVREEGEGRSFQTARAQVFLAKLIPLRVLEREKKKTNPKQRGDNASATKRKELIYGCVSFSKRSFLWIRARPRDAPLPAAVPQPPRTPHTGLSPARRDPKRGTKRPFGAASAGFVRGCGAVGLRRDGKERGESGSNPSRRSGAERGPGAKGGCQTEKILSDYEINVRGDKTEVL